MTVLQSANNKVIEIHRGKKYHEGSTIAWSPAAFAWARSWEGEVAQRVLDNQAFLARLASNRTEAHFLECIDFLLEHDVIDGNRQVLKDALDRAYDRIEDPTGASDVPVEVGLAHIDQATESDDRRTRYDVGDSTHPID